MHQGERGIDNDFRSWHALYYRFKQDDLVGDYIAPPSIRFENSSVNWSKYGLPWDVICGFPKCGIAQIFVKQLPTSLPKNPHPGSKPKIVSYKPVHDPLKLNYSHCELATIQDDDRIRIKKSGNEKVRKEFQQMMSDKLYILLNPAKEI